MNSFGKLEFLMVVSAKTPNSKLNNDVIDKRFRTPTRSPALHQGNENVPGRRSRSTEVTSRFLLPSTSNSATSSSSVSSGASRRSASPLVGRTLTPAKSSSVSAQNSVRRAQSTERQWPGTPRGANTKMSSAAKQLISSTRSLSVSFQGRSFSMPTSAKQLGGGLGRSMRIETTENRQATPSRDRKQISNCKPSDQRLWPGRLRSGNINFLTQSVDFGGAVAIDKTRRNGSPRKTKGLQKPVTNGVDIELDSVVKNFVTENEFAIQADANSAVSIASDSDSVSSGSSASVKDHRGLKGAPHGIVVQSRYSQDTSRFWRVSEPSSPALTDDGSSTPGSSRYRNAKKMSESMVVSSPRLVSTRKGLSSSPRPASPSRLLTSATSNSSRGMPNPITMKNVVNNNIGITQLSSGIVADMRTGKMGENRIADGHELRLLYNRHLQWRFVNERADATMQDQTKKVEKELYNAWVATLQLRNAVQSEKIKLQVQRQMMKLWFALKEQVLFR